MAANPAGGLEPGVLEEPPSRPPARVPPQTIAAALEITIRVGIVVLLATWCFTVVRPFLLPIMWGIIVAVASSGTYTRIEQAVGGRRGLAGTLFGLLALSSIILPIALLSGTLIDGVQELNSALREGRLQVPPPPAFVSTLPLVGGPLGAFWQLASDNLQAALLQLGPQLKPVAAAALPWVGGLGMSVLKFGFAVIIAAVMLAHREQNVRGAHAIADRLLGERGKEYAALAEATVRSVTRGILGVAVIQATLAGIGFLAVGVPGAGLLALVCLFLSVIQITVAVIMMPIAIYMFSSAEPTTAAVFMVWTIFVGLLDNILKPILLGRGVEVPMVVIFVGAIGGFLSEGIIGLFVGAVVLVLGYTMFRSWVAHQTA